MAPGGVRRWSPRAGVGLAVVGLVAACVVAAVAGTLLGASTASSSPPVGTVMLPDGVPYRATSQARDDPTGAETPSASAVVFRPDGVVAHLSADGRQVTFRDTERDEVTGSIGLPGETIGLAPVLGGDLAYATDSGGVVRILDLGTRASGAFVVVGGRPGPLAVSPDGRRAYVGDRDGGALTVIDTGSAQIVGQWRVAHPVSALAVGAGGSRLVVAQRDAGTVDVLDTASGRPVASAAVPPGPFYAPAGRSAVAAGARTAYVAGGTGVTAVDLVSGTSSRPSWTTLPVSGLALSPDGGHLYVGFDENRDDGTSDPVILTVDTVAGRVVGRTDPPSTDSGTGARGGALTVSPDGRRLVLTGGAPGFQVLDLR